MAVLEALDEADAAGKYIKKKLSESAVIIARGLAAKIYQDSIPQKDAQGAIVPASAAYPAIVYNWLGGPTTKGMGGVTLLVNDLWQVRVVAQGNSYALVSDIVGAIKAALDAQAGEPVDDYFVCSAFARGVRFPSSDAGGQTGSSGGQFVNSGGIYEIHVSLNTWED